jgi:hypothetical protein
MVNEMRWRERLVASNGDKERREWEVKAGGVQTLNQLQEPTNLSSSSFTIMASGPWIPPRARLFDDMRNLPGEEEIRTAGSIMSLK